MPVINIEGPAISDIGKKRTLVKEMTASATKAFGLPAEAIVVLIKENLPENVGVGGMLIVDRRKAEN